MTEHAIRDGLISDEGFIFSTFLKSLYYGDSWFSEIDKKSFMLNYHKIIEGILSTPGVSIKIACLHDSADVILGYSIYKGETLHFVYIKPAARKIGIAKSLVPDTIKIATHATKVGLSIIKKKGLIFDPFAL